MTNQKLKTKKQKIKVEDKRPKTKNQKLKIKKEIKHDEKFLFNMFLFLAIISVFNFVFYIFQDIGILSYKKINNSKEIIQIQDSNLSSYSLNDIQFNYPKTSKVSGNSDYLNIDNWGINFYSKSNFVDFEKWFNNNFDNKNCLIKSMDSIGDDNLLYSLYFVDGIDCKNNGLFMVGKKKIGKIMLGTNPDNSYEQVLSSLKF